MAFRAVAITATPFEQCVIAGASVAISRKRTDVRYRKYSTQNFKIFHNPNVFGYHRTKCDITVQRTISSRSDIIYFPQLRHRRNITVANGNNITHALRAYNCTKCNLAAP